MRVQPYLFFDGRCEEALNFYQQVVDAEITQLMRFEDSPEPMPEGMLPHGSEKKIMHASFRVGESEVMASDGHCAGQANFRGFSLSVTLPDAAEVDKRFHALSAGGLVTMPLGPTFFAPRFGMLTDRFGVGWMLIVNR